MFTIVLLVGGIALGVLVTALAERVNRRRASRSLSKSLFAGVKPLPGYLPPGLYSLPYASSDTGGVPIHELDNVDTVKLQLDGIKTWRSR